jgi:hypothetical protein
MCNILLSALISKVEIQEENEHKMLYIELTKKIIQERFSDNVEVNIIHIGNINVTVVEIPEHNIIIRHMNSFINNNIFMRELPSWTAV